MAARPTARLARAAAARLLVLLAVSLGFPQGVAVLCAGPGGHLAVEFAAGIPAAAPEAASDGCGCGEECGPCRDVQVGHDDSAYRPAPAPYAADPPAACVGPVPEAVVTAPPAGDRPAAYVIPPLIACSSHLRTVVLLI
jgi:hypothetical protein